MIDTFMRDPGPNTLAVIVLIALLVTWITSLWLSVRDSPISTDAGWYSKLLPLFTLTGIPAVVDLMQTQGTTFVFAVIVLVVLLLHIAFPILQITKHFSHPLVDGWHRWSVPISVVGGLAVAGYLTFVESTGAQVICGPSGGCDAVQSSRYATLFGFLPVGVLGLIGYLAILIGWLVWQYGPEITRKWSVLAIWAMCIFGVLFSIYLTFLEPFVIGATCMWCISSAVLMIILLLASTPAAQQALAVSEE